KFCRFHGGTALDRCCCLCAIRAAPEALRVKNRVRTQRLPNAPVLLTTAKLHATVPWPACPVICFPPRLVVSPMDRSYRRGYARFSTKCVSPAATRSPTRGGGC